MSVSYASINSTENPADLITMEVTTSTFILILKLWLKVFCWIFQDQAQWPISKLIFYMRPLRKDFEMSPICECYSVFVIFK